jgi:hypothetical protein
MVLCSFSDASEGTTVKQFFAEKVPLGRAQGDLIRVNRQAAAADQVLCHGDRISITPTKIDGAAAWRRTSGGDALCWPGRVLS